ncbi:hypothetical protein J7I80_05760 [Bacillus sp. ISL-41]|uniref:hypothetical protein n=1 Tax=Bacillus sp. ISL-41 TaxID=2819127 RepID=UPI001BE73F87|nr:hypothetical protein [Bacillus sp. ISL-41]MBT2641721.1 hypothetical protein [Bacillus sp. ISL-41]
MGFLSRFTTILFGSKEDEIVRAKKEVAYATTKQLYPKEAKAVEDLVKGQYEKALEQILYTIGNAIRHHARLSNAEHIKNSAFMERFIEDYGFQYFINGVSLGHQTQAGTADVKFQKEISLLMEELHKRMMEDALKSFSSQKIADCFSAGAKTAADSGFQTGVYTYNNGYVLAEK